MTVDYSIIGLFKNYLFISAILSWLVAQIAKSIINIIKGDDFTLMYFLFGTGGMPSSHSAVVTALLVSSILKYGFNSFEFAVTAIVFLIVVRDATGVRLETGKQAKFLNELLRQKYPNGESIPKNVLFKELIGHTPLQVFFGCITGSIVAVVSFFIYAV